MTSRPVRDAIANPPPLALFLTTMLAYWANVGLLAWNVSEQRYGWAAVNGAAVLLVVVVVGVALAAGTS